MSQDGGHRCARPWRITSGVDVCRYCDRPWSWSWLNRDECGTVSPLYVETRASQIQACVAETLAMDIGGPPGRGLATVRGHHPCPALD